MKGVDGFSTSLICRRRSGAVVLQAERSEGADLFSKAFAVGDVCALDIINTGRGVFAGKAQSLDTLVFLCASRSTHGHVTVTKPVRTIRTHFGGLADKREWLSAGVLIAPRSVPEQARCRTLSELFTRSFQRRRIATKQGF